MKQTQFDVVMAEIRAISERIEKIELFLEVFKQRASSVEALDDGADSTELALDQFPPLPATGAVNIRGFHE